MAKEAFQLAEVTTLDTSKLITLHTANGVGPSVKITLENFLAGLVREVITVGVANADYIVTDPDNLHTQLQEAMDYVKDTFGAGVVRVKGRGSASYKAAQMTIPTGVSLLFDHDCYIIGKTNQAPCLFISENFATYAGSGNAFGQGNAHGFFSGGKFEAGTQTASGFTDYRNANAVIKMYVWDFLIKSIRINYAGEVALYTEHDNDWNDDGTFNTYEFGENRFDDIKIKNYGKVGWVNRGPHDSNCDSVYISSSDDSGLNPDYGYVQQTNSATGQKYGSNGFVAHYLHVWGNHNYNAVLLDRSNIIDGFIYAEGCDQAAIYISNSSANRFNAFVGFCTNGVEFQGDCDGNNIITVVESNVTGALYKVNDTLTNSILAQGAGYGQCGGAVFDLATANYDGSKNQFILWAGNTATPFAGISVMHDSDILEGAGKNHLQYTPNDDSYSGTTILATGGESLVFGDVCYIKSDGKMGKADADAIATAGAVFMAMGTIANNAKGLFLVNGVVRDDSAYNFTIGGMVYLSTTAGGVTQTAPSGTGDVVQVLGVALTADKFLFNPNLAMVEIA